MKTRPIIFNGEMVRAILDGRKTQTRRVIKPQPVESFAEDFNPDGTIKERRSYGWTWKGIEDKAAWRSPYGIPGDRLWVRETFAVTGHDLVTFQADNKTRQIDDIAASRLCAYTWTRNSTGWRPSIFMPRWASRITLEVLSVRVERVQDISHADAEAEGIDTNAEPNDYGSGSRYRDIFAALWDSINVKRAYGWDTNPWVWVMEFPLIEMTLEGY